MSKQPKSPAKRKQLPTGPEVKSTRTTRSQAATQQEVASSQPETPTKEMTPCNGCGKEFINLMTHLKAKKECAALYDMDDMQAKMDAKRKEQMAQRNRLQ